MSDKNLGPKPRSTSRKTDLYPAVIQSVAEHGFDRASLRDIASRAGMSHVGLIRHFSSKEALLLAALDFEEAQEQEQMKAFITGEKDESEALKTLVEFTTRDREYARSQMALKIAATDSAHPAHEWFVGRNVRWRNTIDSFASKSDSRSVGKFDPATRANLLIAIIDGLRLLWLTDPKADVASAAGRFAEALFVQR